jgi:hypothetical protein
MSQLNIQKMVSAQVSVKAIISERLQTRNPEPTGGTCSDIKAEMMEQVR